MATLTAFQRRHLKSSTFGLPSQHKYPMPDKSHAVNAKARATQMLKKGKLSEASKQKIDAKANKILGKIGEHSMKKKHSTSEHKAAAKHAHAKHMKHAALHHEIAKHHAAIAKLHKKAK